MANDQNTSSKHESAQMGTWDFRLVGLAVQVSWLYLLLYSGEWTSPLSFTRAAGASDLVYLTSAVALCAVLAVGIARTHSFMKAARSRALQIVAPLAAAVGTLLYCLMSGSNLLLVVFGGLFTGFGSAFLWARWAAVYGRFRPAEIIGQAPLVMAAATLVCFSVGYLDPTLQAIVIIALPALSGIWLSTAERSFQPSEDAPHVSDPKGQPGATGRRKYAVLIAAAAFLGFTSGVLPAFSQNGETGNYDLLFYSGLAFLSLLFVGFAILAENRQGFLTQFAVPAVVMVCVLLPFSQITTGDPAAAVLGPLGSICFELLLLVGSVVFARATGNSPARVYMITRVSMTLFDALGLICGTAIMAQAAASVSMQIAAVALFLLTEGLIAIFAVAYLTTRKNRSADLDPARTENPAIPHEDVGLEGVLDPEKHGDGTAGPKTPLSSTAARGTRGVWIPEEAEGGARGSEMRPSPTEPWGTTGFSVPGPAPSAASALTLEEKCSLVGERFGLSARELDVLQLVAQGCTYARIREALTISQGTVNYHMSNLYTKLGVHSRQEVIDLVSNAEPSL